MTEKNTTRHFIRQAAIVITKAGPDDIQIQNYKKKFENNQITDPEEYKHYLLFDALVGLPQSDLSDIAECVYRIRGEIPNHLLFHEFFVRFKVTHPKRKPLDYFPMNLSDRTLFKYYNGTLPLVCYSTWHSSRKYYYRDYAHACLSFVIWADRFIPYYETIPNKAADNPQPFAPVPYTNSYPTVFWEMPDTVTKARYANFIKETNPKWFDRIEEDAKKEGKPADWNDHVSRKPSNGYGWFGSLIYKPNFKNPVEFSVMMKRLVRTSTEGRVTDRQLLTVANPLFNNFHEKLKESMHGMFDVQLVANKYASSDSPERFAKMAEDFKELAETATKLSKQFQSFKDSKLIKGRTSNQALVGELLAKEIAANPFKYFSETCFRPKGWSVEDSLIFWACRELIQDE